MGERVSGWMDEWIAGWMDRRVYNVDKKGGWIEDGWTAGKLSVTARARGIKACLNPNRPARPSHNDVDFFCVFAIVCQEG